MSKRNRFLIILAVLGICLFCLWPSITWYFRTPKDAQQIALCSLEKIRDYSIEKAVESVKALEEKVKADPNAEVPAEYSWLVAESKKNYKTFKHEVPAKMTMSDLMRGFGFGYNVKTDEQKQSAANAIHNKLVSLFQERYRSRILKDKKTYANSVKLGLDLAGGVNVIIHADLDAAVAAKGDSLKPEQIPFFKQQAMATAIEVITSRIDRFGLTEPVIRQQGEDKIYIEIPGEGQNESINAIIQGKGLLNFRLVDDDATQAFYQYYQSHLADTFDANGKLLDPSIIPDDCEVLGYYVKDSYGLDQFARYYVVKKEIALDGSHIKLVNTSKDRMGKDGVDLTLDIEGGTIFADITAKNVKKQLAIISDNKIKSAPVIKTAITGGQVRVDGFGHEEAENLQKVLETASLDVPLEIESQQVIGATLGALSIAQGEKALIIGLALIMVFMLLYYKGAGINAVVAQVLNLYILFSVLSAFNLTLTLPSIAGMVLTIGMAVDANVIIFERIKEELRLGKSRKAAIEAGFDGAFWAIMDSNITTFIAALFLSILGTGSIQGFAVSLAIGVLSSVFTALFVSRLMFDFGTDVGKSEKVSISWRIK
ncbi:protein translocase subunit SecD [Treponema sp.]|uniref:protein translocase subunit SecD n=1 Tax=Treponema sp. TaxID=166 RepID=UPI00298D7C58|nr:protein translocase subunit SecD [Treponema sp.]MCR5612362.1 protein translocase subunit SecD [Treponema sp.]